MVSDRSPAELCQRLGMRSNLMARHLDVLEQVGLISRTASSADGRRKYVRLHHDRLVRVQPVDVPVPARVLFVCTQNAARSPMAAGLWQRHTGRPARSAGVRPAARVHPGAVAAAARVGVDIATTTPRMLDVHRDSGRSTQVITVCDQVHEELEVPDDWWHWSIPDPVAAGSRRAFDAAVRHLRQRIEAFPDHHTRGASS